jgi:hypothetical protein
MNKLILALLLSFSMTAHAQVSGPGNTFGGGGGETSKTGSVVHPTTASDDFAVGGTNNTPADVNRAPFYFDVATGILHLTTPGAGVSIASDPSVGGFLELEENSSAVGGHSFKMELGATDLTGDVVCTISASGTFNPGCPLLSQERPFTTLTPTIGLTEEEAVIAAAPNALIFSFKDIDAARGGMGEQSYIAGTLIQADPDGDAVKNARTSSAACDNVGACSDEVVVAAGTYRIRIWMKRLTTASDNFCKIALWLNNGGSTSLKDTAGQDASVGNEAGGGGQLSTEAYTQTVWELNVALGAADELGFFVSGNATGTATNCRWGAVVPSQSAGIAYVAIEKTS